MILNKPIKTIDYVEYKVDELMRHMAWFEDMLLLEYTSEELSLDLPASALQLLNYLKGNN